MGSDSISGGARTQWYLRLGDGGVFGPVSIATLVEWAKQGRVMASNEVSTDNQNWRPAASLEELGMSWYIETSNGSLHGPFNRSAADLLARDGRLGSDVKVVPAAEADLSKVCEPASASRKPAASDPQAELDFGASSGAGPESADAIREERESLRLQVNELEEKLRQMVRNAEKEARSQERQKEALRKTIADLQREQEDLRQSMDAAAQEAPGSGLEEALEAARREFADEKSMLEREADALRSRIAELEAENSAAQDANATDCTRLQSELAAAQSELAAVKDSLASMQSELAAALDLRAAAESELSTAKEALATAQRELAAKAADCAAAQEALATAQAAEQAGQSTAAEIDRLQSELAAANEARGIVESELTAAVAARDAAQSELAAAVAASETTQSELADAVAAKDAAQSELAAAVATKDATQSELAAAVAAKDAAQSELSKARSELEAARREFAELLAASNERDAEYQRKIEERQAAPAASSDGAPVAAQIPPRLPVELAESIDVIERVLAAEHEDFAAYRDATLKRQDMLRERMQALRELQETSSNGDGTAEKHTTGSARSFETSRLCDELDGLRLLHQRMVRQSEERERELQRRVRTLESEDARLRARLGEADATTHHLRSVADSLHQREVELEQERYLRKIEQEQSQKTQADMAKRIEELERRINANADNELHPDAVLPPATSAAAPVAPASADAAPAPAVPAPETLAPDDGAPAPVAAQATPPQQLPQQPQRNVFRPTKWFRLGR